MMKRRCQRSILMSCAAVHFFGSDDRFCSANSALRQLNVFSDEQQKNSSDNENYIIIFVESVSNIATMSADEVSTLASDIEAKYELKKTMVFSDSLYGFKASNVTDENLKSLRQENGIYLVEKDGKISIDPLERKTKKRKNKNTKIQSMNSGTNSEQEIVPPGVQQVGWLNVEKNATLLNRRIFIIDSGVSNLDEFNIDVDLARNFVSGENESPDDWSDCNGHGTHVAGTIAAKKNGRGVVGVAAGATIVPIRVLDCTGDGSISDVVAALDYVARNAWPGDVVNLSIGGPTSQKAMDLSLLRASSNTGAKFVVAAGNGSTSAESYTPARVQGNNIYTVCALRPNNKVVASFSNYGKPPVDVCAPGSNILSLSRTGQMIKKSGTSMAAPHVAGSLLFDDLELQGFARSPKDGRRYPILKSLDMRW